MSSPMRAAGPLALAALVFLAACGREDEAARNPLAPVIAHLREHGFEVAEAPARGEPLPDRLFELRAVAVDVHDVWQRERHAYEEDQHRAGCNGDSFPGHGEIIDPGRV